MTKLIKISGISAALILIVLDVLAIANSFSLSGMSIFDNIVNYSIPCGLLLGITALCAVFEKPYRRPLSITTLVLFSISLFLRVVAIVLYILERIYVTYLAPMGYIEYIDLAKYSAFALLSLGVIFLMIYFSKGKFEKTILVLGGISCVSLFAVWAVEMYVLISETIKLSYSVFEIAQEVLSGGLVRDLFTLLAYITVFWIITEINNAKEKA